MEGVYRFLLTPRWWGINVFVLLAIPFCIFMGSWQLSRFEGRVHDSRTAARQAASDQRETAKPLDTMLPVNQATSGRRVSAHGRYGTQLLVPGRAARRQERLLRPHAAAHRLRQGPAGRAGLAAGHGGRGEGPGPAATGEVTVTGALQASETPGDNGVSAAACGLPSGQTAAISSASLVNLVPYKLYDAWITLDTADSGMKPVPATAPAGSGLDLKAFQNLGYTGEWFVFAGFVVFMWFRLLRREAEAVRDVALGLVPEESQDSQEADPAPVSAP
ncbi:SURF1 family protein [Streptomyces lasalocidi]